MLIKRFATSCFLRTGSSRTADNLPPPSRPPVYSNGSGSGNYASSPRGPPPPSGGGAAPESEWRGSSGHGDAEWRNGPNAPVDANGNSGVHAYRANGLAPTGAADAADAWRNRNAGSGTDEPAPAAPAAAAAGVYVPPRRDREESPPPPGAAAGARPRLNLQPRTKPLPVPAAGPGPAAPAAAAAAVPVPVAGDGAQRAHNPFGAARPREEVLRERGAPDPSERDTRLTNGALYAASAGSGGALRAAAGAGSARGGSVASGGSDEDQWHTVGKGGRSSKPPASGADVGNALLDPASDPFFSGRHGGSGVAIVGRSGRAFGGGGGFGSYGSGSKGSDGHFVNQYGASRGYGGGEDDEPIFKRSLPTRNTDLF